MLFSSIFFLGFFLPISILSYLSTPRKYRNITLLFLSLLFYAWGEPKMVFVMLFVVITNYFSGILIAKDYRKIGMCISILTSMGTLAVFKYTNFAYDSFTTLITELGISYSWMSIPRIALPVGISFYTFQTLSYNVDIYRNNIKPCYNLIDFATYVSFFPQLVAGPIVRFTDVREQLGSRGTNLDNFASGIERFILGLAKKVIIANNCAYIADLIFDLHPKYVSVGSAWLGITFYTLQIYFDFSGYSDMAIGLARIFGFRFQENFNYPYISNSIKEFWRRWHISLSSWFRDYLYISLGGNRKGKYRTYINLSIVFIVTGLWHGASWNFIIWGIWHGLFIVLERMGGDKILEKTPKPIQHIYTLLVVMIGWVFFRSANLEMSLLFIQNLFGGLSTDQVVFHMADYLTVHHIIILSFALLFCSPVFPAFRNRLSAYMVEHTYIEYIYYVCLLLLLIFLIAAETITTFTPFIYFRF